MALKIEKNCVVSLAYRILDKDGRILDERTPDQNYSYLHGHGQIIAPVERRLEGKTAGFHDEVLITPREAYGDYKADLVTELERKRFPAGLEVKVGLKFSTRGPDGQPITVRVIDVDDEIVTVDGNHTLAGLDLLFDVRVLGVREARPDEVTQGRVDAPAGSSGQGVDDEDDSGSSTIH
jgi:FKBP-type peptidyl-prolyl cis-trans isomerase SlyD